ncbi:Down syndrome cell adhesion molecule-like [Centruroides sculpturatus]|uniref:Down syndrome cell adhesion molecule-like n=1 Tax=Centruroides sculpturatus TaxID=218467 RepID=UPI000C6D7D1C|nr:Down syndrome cell adhesion molecule-like [Centruroides sculpturatus]
MKIKLLIILNVWILNITADKSDNNNSPKIQPFNFPPNLSVGQSTKFLCTLVEGAHPVSFRWFKDGQEITGNKNIEITKLRDISILIFNNINIEDAGNYTCIASNKFGSVNHTSLLAVEAPPRWISEPQDIDITSGNSIKIKCSATGFPIPKVSWRRMNGNVNEFVILTLLLEFCHQY